MTSPSSPPAAGWHINSNGQQQWWDGAAWGPLAPGELGTAGSSYVGRVAVKSRTTAYWLAILLGTFGAHRFYTHKYATAWVLVAITSASVLFHLDPDPRSAVIGNVLVVFAFLWVISDLWVIPSMVRAANTNIAAKSRGV